MILTLFLYLLLTLLIGQYIAFIKAGQECPDGNCSDINLKKIFIKGLIYGTIAPIYIVYKIVPLIKVFSGNKFDWLDF